MSHPLVGMIVLLSMECSGIIEALESTEAATKKQRELKQAIIKGTIHCVAGRRAWLAQ